MDIHPGAVPIDHRKLCEEYNVWLWHNLPILHPARRKWDELWRAQPTATEYLESKHPLDSPDPL